MSTQAPVALAVNGVPILAPHTLTGRDLLAEEVQDACGGRTTPEGLYYYRGVGACLGRGASVRAHSPLVAYARDGYAVYGRRGTGGRVLRNQDLDACHGHVHTVRRPDGTAVRTYHYHATAEFPYVAGCFRARPSVDWRLAALPPATTPGIDPPMPVPSPIPAPASTPFPTRPPLSVGLAPALIPPYDPSVIDYAVRCDPPAPVELTVAAPRGTTVAVDGQAPRGGQFTTPVVLGLGQRFAFRVISAKLATTHHVRCLPRDFPDWTAARTGIAQAEWYLVTPSFGPPPSPYVVFFDRAGVPVWFRRTTDGAPTDARLLPDGRLAWAILPADLNATSAHAYEIHRLDGTLDAEVRTVGSPTDYRELLVLPNGNYITDTYRARDHVDLSPYGGPADATVQDAEIQELTPAGDLVWSWNSKDHIGLAETGRWYSSFVLPAPARTEDGRTAYDIVHLNSIALAEDGDLVASFRHLDAVLRIDKATGAIEWKVGGVPRPESLSLVGDSFGNLGGNHDARLLADGTLSLHENGTFRGRPPRVARYRLDTLARTATLVEQLTDDDARMSFCCGSARLLSGGNWVVSWGSTPLMTELTPAGARVFTLQLRIPNTSYRAVPIEPGRLARKTLRAAMDVMNPR